VESIRAIRFLERLTIPEGALAGQLVKLAPFQRQFIDGALAPGVTVAALSIGRGNAKTALAAGLALGALLGEWDRQPHREIPIAARTRDQAKIAWDFAARFARSLPESVQKQLTFRRSPRLEIEYDGDGGGHVIRAIAADGKSALGTAPTFALLDERGHWQADQGDELEHAILSALGKRGGRALIISTSAPDDVHPFSKWLDEPQPGTYRQEHRPPPGLPADDADSLLVANPGAAHGIGASLEWLQAQARGGYRGIPVPWQALEKRVGETIASGTPSPKVTAPIIDRLFPESVAARMGTQMVNIAQGTEEYPITTSAVTAGWAATETGAVAGPTVYSTAQRSLTPANTFGITMKITRKALKQSGDGLEQAVRRDMNGAIGMGLDAAVFLGTGASGQPTGVIPGAVGYGITVTSVAASATWAPLRTAVTAFLVANAANSPAAVRLLARPELWGFLDGKLITSTAVSEWDRMLSNIPAGNIVLTSNALAAPTGSPVAASAVLTTVVGGVPPIFLGTWGAIDLIRDPYSDAASGGLRLTGLVTADVTVSRAVQLQILTGLQLV
jgi:hypothetical protein